MHEKIEAGRWYKTRDGGKAINKAIEIAKTLVRYEL